MAKGPWKRGPTTGLPVTLIERLDEASEDGEFDVAQLQDCDRFNRASITKAAGYRNVSRFMKVALADPRFHHHKLRDPEGHLITIATHANSATWYGQQLRAEGVAASRANLRRGAGRWVVFKSEA